MADFDFTKAIDVTVSPLSGYGARGVPWATDSVRTIVAGNSTDCSEAWSTGLIHVSPHSGTHLDLPWAMEGTALKYLRVLEGFRDMAEARIPPLEGSERPWDEILSWINDIEWKLDVQKGPRPEQYGLPLGPPRRAAISEYLCPDVRKCIIVDFTDFAEEVKQYVSTFEEEESKIEILKPDLPVGELVRLIEFLCITKDKLLKAFENSSKLRSKNLRELLLIIRTGWPDVFLPRTEVDILGPRFECWVPWLLHPYLDGDAAKWLSVDQQVWGVGIDCLNFENPVYYASSSVWAPAVQARRHFLTETGKFPATLQLAHLNVLWRGKRLIENIGSMGKQMLSGTVSGKACILPFPLSLIGDGAFVRMFLQVDDNID